MNKFLEALEKIKDRADHDEYLFRKDVNTEKASSFLKENNESCSIIEKELKRLEDIDSILNMGGGIWAENGIVSKKLKALEIIKKKSVNIRGLFLSKNSATYNSSWNLKKYPERNITQDEYDLLKEVLNYGDKN